MARKCGECGVEMEDMGTFFECPICGKTYSKPGYAAYNKSLGYIPEGCSACGGPYPSCKTSCSLFDD